MGKAQELQVSEFEFPRFTEEVENNGPKEFKFGQLLPDDFKRAETHQRVIKIERADAQKNNFTISPIVRQHRGMIDQESDERERRIRDEVERRVTLLEEDAFKKGFEDGVERGRQEIFEQTRSESDEKLQTLTGMISEVLAGRDRLIAEEKANIYKLVRTLTKWVILRELSDDGRYVERLLEKLVQEVQTKSNLLIQVDTNQFEAMPEVLEQVQKRLGELKNVRVEVDYGLTGPGIIIESENGIVNGTLSQQMASLDKLFASVGLAEDINE
jgi:flagellar assembly protein FliH